VRGAEAFLVGASISEYQPANTPKNYDKDRPRKLLLSKKEIAEIENQTDKTSLTAVAIRLYNKNGKIKLELAIARGKKKFDKREVLKQRDSKRDIERTLKNQ
jgi:SsrA-binding protein